MARRGITGRILRVILDLLGSRACAGGTGWLAAIAVGCRLPGAFGHAARSSGRGIAPGSWSAIAEALAAEGVTTIITKVGIENAPSRRAVTEAGFREIGLMRLTRLGGRKQASLEVMGAGVGDQLAYALAAN